MENIDDFIYSILESEGYSQLNMMDLLTVSNSAYGLIFKNNEYCGFEKFFSEVSSYLISSVDPDLVIFNVQRNALLNVGYLLPIMQVYNMKDNIRTFR